MHTFCYAAGFHYTFNHFIIIKYPVAALVHWCIFGLIIKVYCSRTVEVTWCLVYFLDWMLLLVLDVFVWDAAAWTWCWSGKPVEFHSGHTAPGFRFASTWSATTLSTLCAVYVGFVFHFASFLVGLSLSP